MDRTEKRKNTLFRDTVFINTYNALEMRYNVTYVYVQLKDISAS